ncbi:MAG TPA: hypothetical protein VMU28_11620 [Terriglobales bacterium]|nr:hypothetical protein [Terriglobales bacterium]
MISADDPRWRTMQGGYRMPLDPRPLVEKLERGDEAVWKELWNELHHQGDVGDASYAAVPLLVKVHRRRGTADWNVYALTATIELERTEHGNPAVPEWLSEDYFGAIQELSSIGTQDIIDAKDPELIRAILGVIALAKGLRTYAKFLVWYADDELREIESKAFE